jgi:hypothetical protein
VATYKIYKETALPGTLQPHSIYLIAPAARPNYVEMYVTGASASTVKRVIDQADIQTMIDNALAGISGGATIVDNITARNAIASPKNGLTVLVIDASADATVNAGAATYVYRQSDTSWIKISEYESLDLSLSWANLTGKPTSSVADIDNAVSLRHSHTNKTQLDKVGESAGRFTYNGAAPTIDWDSTGW